MHRGQQVARRKCSPSVLRPRDGIVVAIRTFKFSVVDHPSECQFFHSRSVEDRLRECTGGEVSREALDALPLSTP